MRSINPTGRIVPARASVLAFPAVQVEDAVELAEDVVGDLLPARILVVDAVAGPHLDHRAVRLREVLAELARLRLEELVGVDERHFRGALLRLRAVDAVQHAEAGGEA